MRNRWGVEIKRGRFAFARGPRGGDIQGRIVSIDRTSALAKAYGPRVTLEGGQSVGADDISETIGKMTISADGTVKQNPAENVTGWDAVSTLRALKREGRKMLALEKDTFPRGVPLGGWRLAPESARDEFDAITMRVIRCADALGILESDAWNYAFGRRTWAEIKAKRAGDREMERNPLSRTKIGSPSQRAHRTKQGGTSKAPTARLKARRAKTAKTRIVGVYANPATPVPYRNAAKSRRVDDPAWVGYAVHRPSSPSSAYAIFKTRAEAVEYARELATKKNAKMGVTRIEYKVPQS